MLAEVKEVKKHSMQNRLKFEDLDKRFDLNLKDMKEVKNNVESLMDLSKTVYLMEQKQETHEAKIKGKFSQVADDISNLENKINDIRYQFSSIDG
jgi:hypothetical protein